MSKAGPRIKIEWTKTALNSLLAVGSKTTRRKIVAKVDALLASENPEQIGRPLQGDLAGLYRITHGRYRIIYEVRRTGKGPNVRVKIIVRILYIGLIGLRRTGSRRDVYVQIAKLLRRLRG